MDNKYGGFPIYGKLVKAEKAIVKYRFPIETNELQGKEGVEALQKLKNFCKEVYIDINQEEYGDTIFFKPKEDVESLYKLLKLIPTLRPDEFDEGEDKVFRMWWD